MAGLMEFRRAWERSAILDYRMDAETLRASWQRCQRKGISRALQKPLRFADPDPRLGYRLTDFWPVAQDLSQIYGDPTLFILFCDMQGCVIGGAGSQAMSRFWEGLGLTRQSVLESQRGGSTLLVPEFLPRRQTLGGGGRPASGTRAGKSPRDLRTRFSWRSAEVPRFRVPLLVRCRRCPEKRGRRQPLDKWVR